MSSLEHGGAPLLRDKLGVVGKRRAPGMGSIKFRKNGTWEGKYAVAGDRNRRSVYARTRQEVEQKLADAIAENGGRSSTKGPRPAWLPQEQPDGSWLLVWSNPKTLRFSFRRTSFATRKEASDALRRINRGLDPTPPTRKRRALRQDARFAILQRDNFTCRYCGAKAPDVRLEIDHIIPVVAGGTNEPDNLTTACIDCNNGKAALLLEKETA